MVTHAKGCRSPGRLFHRTLKTQKEISPEPHGCRDQRSMSRKHSRHACAPNEPWRGPSLYGEQTCDTNPNMAGLQSPDGRGSRSMVGNCIRVTYYYLQSPHHRGSRAKAGLGPPVQSGCWRRHHAGTAGSAARAELIVVGWHHGQERQVQATFGTGGRFARLQGSRLWRIHQCVLTAEQ